MSDETKVQATETTEGENGGDIGRRLEQAVDRIELTEDAVKLQRAEDERRLKAEVPAETVAAAAKEDAEEDAALLRAKKRFAALDDDDSEDAYQQQRQKRLKAIGDARMRSERRRGVHTSTEESRALSRAAAEARRLREEEASNKRAASLLTVQRISAESAIAVEAAKKESEAQEAARKQAEQEALEAAQARARAFAEAKARALGTAAPVAPTAPAAPTAPVAPAYKPTYTPPPAYEPRCEEEIFLVDENGRCTPEEPSVVDDGSKGYVLVDAENEPKPDVVLTEDALSEEDRAYNEKAERQAALQAKGDELRGKLAEAERVRAALRAKVADHQVTRARQDLLMESVRTTLDEDRRYGLEREPHAMGDLHTMISQATKRAVRIALAEQQLRDVPAPIIDRNNDNIPDRVEADNIEGVVNELLSEIVTYKKLRRQYIHAINQEDANRSSRRLCYMSLLGMQKYIVENAMNVAEAVARVDDHPANHAKYAAELADQIDFYNLLSDYGTVFTDTAVSPLDTTTPDRILAGKNYRGVPTVRFRDGADNAEAWKNRLDIPDVDDIPVYLRYRLNKSAEGAEETLKQNNRQIYEEACVLLEESATVTATLPPIAPRATAAGYAPAHAIPRAEATSAVSPAHAPIAVPDAAPAVAPVDAADDGTTRVTLLPSTELSYGRVDRKKYNALYKELTESGKLAAAEEKACRKKGKKARGNQKTVAALELYNKNAEVANLHLSMLLAAVANGKKDHAKKAKAAFAADLLLLNEELVIYTGLQPADLPFFAADLPEKAEAEKRADLIPVFEYDAAQILAGKTVVTVVSDKAAAASTAPAAIPTETPAVPAAAAAAPVAPVAPAAPAAPMAPAPEAAAEAAAPRAEYDATTARPVPAVGKKARAQALEEYLKAQDNAMDADRTALKELAAAKKQARKKDRGSYLTEEAATQKHLLDILVMTLSVLFEYKGKKHYARYKKTAKKETKIYNSYLNAANTYFKTGKKQVAKDDFAAQILAGQEYEPLPVFSLNGEDTPATLTPPAAPADEIAAMAAIEEAAAATAPVMTKKQYKNRIKELKAQRTALLEGGAELEKRG